MRSDGGSSAARRELVVGGVGEQRHSRRAGRGSANVYLFTVLKTALSTLSAEVLPPLSLLLVPRPTDAADAPSSSKGMRAAPCCHNDDMTNKGMKRIRISVTIRSPLQRTKSKIVWWRP